MQENLQELHDFISERFPNIRKEAINKIIFSIKSRHREFKTIGFSRYEHYKFGISEKKLRNIIDYLRAFGILEFTHTKIHKERICNVYKIGEAFVEMFESLEHFIKNTFEYLDPIVFMKAHFTYIFKYGFYVFKHNGNKYQISKKGKYAGKIYGISENKIINPFDLL